MTPKVKVPLTEEEREIYAMDINWSSMTATFNAQEETFLVRDTQMRMKFDDIPPNTMIHHRHMGTEAEESNASAKTFCRGNTRGFKCFRCHMIFLAADDNPVYQEERYFFNPRQIMRAEEIVGDDGRGTGEYHPYMLDLPSCFFHSRKWTILDAGMGTGKTHQLANLVQSMSVPSYRRFRVLVVTFRVSLAFQTAQRLKLQCYRIDQSGVATAEQKVLDKKIKNDEFDRLCICINSLPKLGPKKWDYVLFDECGLIKDHCMSSITTPQLPNIYPRLIACIKDASHVILSQEYVSVRDVEFYMGIDDQEDIYDEEKVSALRFVRPAKIHDIEHTTDLFHAVDKLLECYDEAFDEDGECKKPFMCFVSKVAHAEFLVHILTNAAEKKFGDNEEVKKRNVRRIRGLWSGLRGDRFVDEFLHDPNGNASRVDVLICTSIICAGFSINTHFLSFHAFLTADVLDHWTERQFIQRLRFIMAIINGVRPTPLQSYLYIEKGRGSSSDMIKDATLVENLTKKFNEIRAEIAKKAVLQNDRLLTCQKHLGLLACAQSSVIAKVEATRRTHDKLWDEYGKELQSKYNPWTEQLSKERVGEIKNQLFQFAKKFRSDIGMHLQIQMLEGSDDPEDFNGDDAVGMLNVLAELEMMEVMVNAAVKTRFTKWKDHVASTGVACEIIRMKHAGDKREKLERALAKPDELLTRIQHMACWLTYCYHTLGGRNEGDMLFESYYANRYQTRTLRAASGMILASRLIPELLGRTGSYACEALGEPGSTPFYLEARFAKHHNGWADYWGRLFNIRDDDSQEAKDYKTENRRLFDLITIDGVSGSADKRLEKITRRNTDQQAREDDTRGKNDQTYPAFTFFTRLLAHLGLVARATTKGDGDEPIRCSDGQVRPPWKISLRKEDFALLLLTKQRFIDRVRTMIPELLHSENLSAGGKVFVEDAITVYNEAVDHMVDNAEVAVDEQDDTTRAVTRLEGDVLRISIAQPMDVDSIEIVGQRKREIDARERETTEEDQQRQEQSELGNEMEAEEVHPASRDENESSQTQMDLDSDYEFDDNNDTSVVGSLATAMTTVTGSLARSRKRSRR